VSRRGRAIHRADLTAKALIAEAQKRGANFLPHDGSIDGTLEYRGKYYLVDWKSKGATLTERQSKLVAKGWKIEFISTVDQLQHLLREEE
jgi:ATP-dependent exoDNAse (exonuclease V) beta subunit